MATASPAIHAADQRSGSISPNEQVTQQTPANSAMAAIVGHTPGLLRTTSAERKTVTMATIRIEAASSTRTRVSTTARPTATGTQRAIHSAPVSGAPSTSARATSGITTATAATSQVAVQGDRPGSSVHGRGDAPSAGRGRSLEVLCRRQGGHRVTLR